MTIEPIDNDIQKPDRLLPASDLRRMWVDNPREALTLVYGNRHPEAAGYLGKHNHSDQGGEILPGISLASIAQGPYRRRRGGISPGFPLLSPAPGVSFTGAPKLIGAVPLRIIGGVTGVRLELLFLAELDTSPQAFTLLFVLRPFSFVNFNDFSSSISESDFTFGHLKRLQSSFSSGQTFVRETVDFADLTRLGNAKLHRNVELCVFLASNPSDNNFVTLSGITPRVLSTTNQVRSAAPLDAEDARVTPAEVQTGSRLSTGLSGKAKAASRNLALATLGGTPGFENGQVSLSRPWRQQIYEAHPHTGEAVVLEDGTVESLGRPLPYALFTQSFCLHQREVGDDETEDNEPVEGVEFHPDGNLGATWRTFSARVSLGAGFRVIFVRLAVQPANETLVPRLFFYAHLHPVGEAASTTNNLLAQVGQGGGLVGAGGDGFIRGEVLPTETPGWQATPDLLAQGWGLWGLASQLVPAQLPQGVLQEKAWRISQPVRLQIRSDVTLKTQDYTLEYRLALATNADFTIFDSTARLVWCFGYPG